MASEEGDLGRPTALLILIYLILHETWRRFVFGDYAFVLLRLLFMVGVGFYYKYQIPNLRLTDLFGIGTLREQSAKVLCFFLILCVTCRLIIHYYFTKDELLPILINTHGIALFNLQSIVNECVIPPINEEILFRGLFLSIFLHELRQNSAAAIFLSALVFANCHDINSTTFIVAFGQALFVYGPAYVLTGSVVFCMILHFVWNALVFVPLP